MAAVAVRLKVAQFRELHADLFATAVKPARGRAGGASAKPKVTTLDQLLVPRLLGPGLKLDPEQALSSQLYHALVGEYRAQRLACIFTCISNEHRAVVYDDETKFRAVAAQTKKTAMGCVVGFTDWVFLWAGGGLAAELKIPGGEKVMTKVQRVGGSKMHPTKRPPGRLSDEQLVVQEWCRQMNVPHAVWYSVEEAIGELRQRGALLPLP